MRRSEDELYNPILEAEFRHERALNAINELKKALESIPRVITTTHRVVRRITTYTEVFPAGGAITRPTYVKAYQFGGYVPRDLLAFLHRGEYVLTKEEYKEWVNKPVTTTINIGTLVVRSEADIDSLASEISRRQALEARRGGLR